MGDFFDKKRVLWAGMMIFVFASFLAMNCLTPYVADDYGNLPPFVPDGIKRDQSIGNIVAPVIQSYRSWGGGFLFLIMVRLCFGCAVPRITCGQAFLFWQ